MYIIRSTKYKHLNAATLHTLYTIYTFKLSGISNTKHDNTLNLFHDDLGNENSLKLMHVLCRNTMKTLGGTQYILWMTELDGKSNERYDHKQCPSKKGNSREKCHGNIDSFDPHLKYKSKDYVSYRM
jgi:hypothetical protein